MFGALSGLFGGAAGGGGGAAGAAAGGFLGGGGVGSALGFAGDLVGGLFGGGSSGPDPAEMAKYQNELSRQQEDRQRTTQETEMMRAMVERALNQRIQAGLAGNQDVQSSLQRLMSGTAQANLSR